jgi:dUTP pyrophosphatase
MSIVKFKKLHADAKLPIKGSEHDAAHDVYAHSITRLTNGKVKVGLGFATEIPQGMMGIMVPRSNLTRHFWVLNNSYGVIDSDYRGEWMAIFTPLTWKYDDEGIENFPVRLEDEFPYAVGERVAQIYFQKIDDVVLEEVDELSDTDRGEGGFGSTGVK